MQGDGETDRQSRLGERWSIKAIKTRLQPVENLYYKKIHTPAHKMQIARINNLWDFYLKDGNCLKLIETVRPSSATRGSILPSYRCTTCLNDLELLQRYKDNYRAEWAERYGTKIKIYLRYVPMTSSALSV
jgi:hypothetical protein